MWRGFGVATILLISLFLGPEIYAQVAAPDCSSGPVCTDTSLTLLTEVLAGAAAEERAAIGARPQRLRQAEARLEAWRQRLDRECAGDLGCLQRSHLDQINKMRGDAPPLVWSFDDDGSITLAEAPPLGSIPSLPVVGLAPELEPLIGYWRGTTVCNGQDAVIEIAIEPGYAGRVFAFVGAWNTTQSADNPAARDEFIVLNGADGVTYALDPTNSRIRKSGPHVRFGDIELVREPMSGAMELINAGGNCDTVALASSPRSESLDALIEQARAIRNPRWSWPYDPREIPAPADHAFCSTLLGWANHYFDHFPETVPIHPEDLTPVAMLDLPGFIALVGRPYDALSEQDRKAFLMRVNQSCSGALMARSLQLHEAGVLRLVRSQERAASHQHVLGRLDAVRFGRDWMADRAATLALLGANSQDYTQARAIEAEAGNILAPLLAGEIASFSDAVVAARTRSAPAFARSEVERLFNTSEGANALLLIDTIKIALADVVSDMAPADALAFSALVDGHVETVIAREVPLRLAALDLIANGEAVLSDSRGWYAAFIGEFGAYRGQILVADALDRFREHRLQLVSNLADRVISELQAAENEGAFAAYVEASLIPDIDSADQVVGPVYQARLARFERERQLLGYSELERSLADALGVIAVPQTYPEPTEDEVALATARAYGRYGGNRRDGSFTYGVFRESAADMRVSSVEKSQCAREPEGAYRCVVKINLDIRMPGAISAALGSQDIGDMAMLYIQDQSNATPASFTEHLFVLTPQGWQSPTLMLGAEAGIAAGLNTLGQVATGVGCTLADLEC